MPNIQAMLTKTQEAAAAEAAAAASAAKSEEMHTICLVSDSPHYVVRVRSIDDVTLPTTPYNHVLDRWHR